MKTSVLLIRHGQSLGNLSRTFLGHTDRDLSPLGYEQARLLGEHLKDREIDAAEASDLLRAFHTAEGALTHHAIPIVKNPAFREIYAGKWEDHPFSLLETEFAEDYRVWRERIGDARPTGGESVCELAARIYAAFDDLVERYSGKTVLVATHATPIRLLKCRALGIPVCEAHTVPWAPNASLTEILKEDGRLTLLLDGEDSFLGEHSSVLPKNV